jgi:hypothetical protein
LTEDIFTVHLALSRLGDGQNLKILHHIMRLYVFAKESSLLDSDTVTFISYLFENCHVHLKYVMNRLLLPRESHNSIMILSLSLNDEGLQKMPINGLKKTTKNKN